MDILAARVIHSDGQHYAEMDLVRDYALPIPTTVIAEMLGVPAKGRHKFHRWSAAIVSSNSSR
jgi:cytochrome P450